MLMGELVNINSKFSNLILAKDIAGVGVCCIPGCDDCTTPLVCIA